jgi:hypothetical protein
MLKIKTKRSRKRLKPKNYENLYNRLQKKNIILINNPVAYKNGHWLPNSYDKIKDCTPYSNWIHIENLKNDFDQIYRNLSEFGNKPIIIKDYVKSRKHEWNESFFTPDASDRNHATIVIKNFIDRQGEHINEGIVFREFVNLDFNDLQSSCSEYWKQLFYDGHRKDGFWRLDNY